MWEQELTSLIQHFYPEVGFEEALALKQIIYLMVDFRRQVVPFWETMTVLQKDINSSCKKIEDARRVVTDLIDKKIVDLVLVECEYDNGAGGPILSVTVPSLDIKNTNFTSGALSIIKDVYNLSVSIKKSLHKITTKINNVKTVAADELRKELAFKGYNFGATYFANANVPPEAVVISEKYLSEEHLRRPKDNDLIAQVINKFYPLLDEKQKCYLNYLARIKHCEVYVEELPIRLLEYESALFQKYTDVDRVEQELCDKGILTREIFRFVDYWNDYFHISPPRKGIDLRDDFWAAIFALRHELGEPEWYKQYRQTKTGTKQV